MLTWNAKDRTRIPPLLESTLVKVIQMTGWVMHRSKITFHVSEIRDFMQKNLFREWKSRACMNSLRASWFCCNIDPGDAARSYKAPFSLLERLLAEAVKALDSDFIVGNLWRLWSIIVRISRKISLFDFEQSCLNDREVYLNRSCTKFLVQDW